jgi:hypothetical protein
MTGRGIRSVAREPNSRLAARPKAVAANTIHLIFMRIESASLADYLRVKLPTGF